MSLNRNLEARAMKRFNVPASAVWDALIDPEKVKRYLYGTRVVSSWEVGTEICFSGEYNGHAYFDKGIILENERNKVLSYTYWSSFSGISDVPENYSEVKFVLENASGSCVLSVMQQGFKSEEDRKHSESAWGQVLNTMLDVVSGDVN